MTYQFIERFRSSFQVEKMCHSLDVSRSGYYHWSRKKVSERKQKNELLVQAIKRIRLSHPQKLFYGSPRMTEELKVLGYPCSENRIARLMHTAGIFAKQKKRFKHTTDSNHKRPVAENMLQQKFNTDKPNQIWVSDITYIWTDEGWLYLAGVLDLYSRKVVGWAQSERITQELVLQAINNAIVARRPNKDLIIHSDRGSQYASEKVQALIGEYGFRQSMSGRGNCYDNAVMESFWHTLKVELIYWRKYATREDARKDIFDYIEVFYNRERRHSTLSHMAPALFEARLALSA